MATVAGFRKNDKVRQGPDAKEAASQTLGKTNAVRAAFMARIKPATIARQFGVSQSAVRKALASAARPFVAHHGNPPS